MTTPDSPTPRPAPLVEVANLKTYFPVNEGVLSRTVGHVHAVDDISFHIGHSEVVGLVGESGSGKTTVGRSLVRLNRATAGSIRFEGQELTGLSDREFQPYRRKMQIIFQDPFASLDPRKRVDAIIGEALSIHRLGRRSERRGRIAELLRLVGLPEDAMARFPHEFSGGQRQRIGIARALAVEPRFVIADEPVSALDVSVQAQIVNLIQDLQSELGLSLLFIAHDLGVIEHLCDRTIVMYLGRIMEVAPTKRLYSAPRHPYTRALLSAAPSLDRNAAHEKQVLEGEVPSPINPPSGCVFRTRCPYAIKDCAEIVPPAIAVEPDHVSACIRTELFQ
ncbi:ABC transporter ATP-binding protein [Consotaella salsifontis]|uniref:Peptide/nickel transport system ATP-binding protein/oligopeptide transport system ATP-binding protein n=1 Tax=Consotaella salsifontis TaxID=1365950 RepID=A0A1T4SNT1_9HYPH|nr:ABC transporter ATP-binding protein [Consotaella salsifontis]SKA29964.1 peptide/nickel transport system ATP-binding protein/oligopeptide transport system ATP-binding protein [Consotaella salsifontis]